MTKRTGNCLCGAVGIEAETPDSFAACHCGVCRRWGGGPMLALHAQSASIDGEEHVVRYASSDWAERAFCKACGTHLFYRVKETDEHIISLGVLDDTDGASFDLQIFMDEKSSAYDFANDTRTMTGAEVFAMFAPKE